MIKSLHVKNYILIDELKLDFSSGFNVFTGETGAGKSIILNAIDVALGAKATSELIKGGSTAAYTELTIECSNLKDLFAKENLDVGQEFVLSREITPNSSRCRIDGILVNLDFVRELRARLLDIHTQHQTYSYIQPKCHIDLLDRFANPTHQALLAQYRSTYLHYVSIKAELEKAKTLYASTKDKIDFLKFQINELESAELLDPKEDEKLEEELNFLSNAQKIKEQTFGAYWALSGDGANVLTVLGSVCSDISKLTGFDKNLEAAYENFIQATELLKDASSELRSYSENLEFDEARLCEVSERIEVLEKIKRKYGATLEDAMINLESLVSELNSISNSQNECERLESELKKIESATNELAHRLSQSRKSLSGELSALVVKELEKLELPKVRFEIQITPAPICANGADNVEFMISTNSGEQVKPLAKTASGGEISRVMLALKTVFAKADEIPTVIFDEIDTGISGKASNAVALALFELSKSRQLIVITHQPIIASKADSHFWVSKIQTDKTSVKVEKLDGEKRQKAIAELASGNTDEQSLNFAQQLLNFS